MRLGREVRLRIVAADPVRMLAKLVDGNIEPRDLEWIDELTVEMRIPYSALSGARTVMHENGADYRITAKEGFLWQMMGLVTRPVMLIGLAVILLLAVILPKRVLFVRILGNETVAEKQILEYVRESGLRFGVKASYVRSENTKNYLLSQLPQLQWVGVTTNGCIATVRVKERSLPDSAEDGGGTVTGIVAVCDGVITDLTVESGNPLITVGQSVKAGDILISGYTDCGRVVTVSKAAGEVYAHTLREITLVTHNSRLVRGYKTDEHRCYQLFIGKKVINLCNDSGIHDSTCVKMYSEYCLVLPGGFRLPVSVVKQTCAAYDLQTETVQEATDWADDYARKYLLKKIVAGQILEGAAQDNRNESCGEFRYIYACHEMIGQLKYEEIVEQYAEDN